MGLDPPEAATLLPGRITARPIGFHAFGEIGPGDRLFLKHQVLPEERVPAQVETVGQQLLGRPGGCGVGAGVLGQPALEVFQSAVFFHEVIDHADAFRFPPVNHVAPDDQGLGAPEPHVARETEGPEAGNQTFLDRR